jgi:hypothetical protein
LAEQVKLVLAIAVFTLIPVFAHAWNAAGHKTIAPIA